MGSPNVPPQRRFRIKKRATHYCPWPIFIIESFLSNSSLSPVRQGVDFVLPLSQQEQQEQQKQEQEEPPPKSYWSLTLNTKSCYYLLQFFLDCLSDV